MSKPLGRKTVRKVRALWVLELSCGHFVEENRGAIHDEFWCARHAKIVKIQRRRPVWYIRCLDCTFARSHTSSPFLAERGASNHLAKQPLHRVQIWEGPRLSTVKQGRPQMHELPEAPPY